MKAHLVMTRVTPLDRFKCSSSYVTPRDHTGVDLCLVAIASVDASVRGRIRWGTVPRTDATASSLARCLASSRSYRPAAESSVVAVTQAPAWPRLLPGSNDAESRSQSE